MAKVFYVIGFDSTNMNRDKFNRMNKVLVQWKEMTDEIEHFRQEYDKQGWETLVLHPGDVVPKPSENDAAPKFKLVVPDSELHELSEFVAEKESEYDEYEVHKADADEVEIFLMILKSIQNQRALFYPVYYDPDVDVQFVDDIGDSNIVHTTITDLGKSQEFVFFHDQPELFLQ